MIIDWTRAHYRGGQYYGADNLWNWTGYSTPLVGAPEEGNMIFARDFTDTIFARVFADTIISQDFADTVFARVFTDVIHERDYTDVAGRR